MSRLSPLVTGLSIVPGETIVSSISTADKNGIAALVLSNVASNSDGEKTRVRREFPNEWTELENGVLTKTGVVRFEEKEYPLTVTLGAEGDGLVIRVVEGDGFSLRSKTADMILNIGSKYDIRGNRISSLATNLVGCWVVHGVNWQNRAGEMIYPPFGRERRKHFDKFCFEIIDGAKLPSTNLAELIAHGCERSTHVGEWNARHSTIIPAAVGMSVVLHEFKEKGTDVCAFNGLNIGMDSDFWGPYCVWNEKVRHSTWLGDWRALAVRSNSPFAFHVHATKLLFLGTRLDSSVILETVGQDRFRKVLELMIQHEPERFYRLVDARGRTYRLDGVGETNLCYKGFGVFPKNQVVENVMDTFAHLQSIDQDCNHRMPREPARLVIDSHAYIVIEALASGKQEVYQLSGRDMHKYLTQGSDSRMHRVRNERLFLLLRDLFGVKTMRFVIYPPLSWNSGLSSQYDQDLAKFDKSNWLNKAVT